VSSNEVDRLSTVIEPRGIDYASFNRSGGPVLWQHGAESRGSLPVGKSTVQYRREHDDLVARVTFREDEFSRELFSMFADQTLTGWSIRALPHSQACGPPSYEEVRMRPELGRCNTIYRSCELVEISAVAIPGSRSAVTLMIERGLWSASEARRYTATHHVPVKAPSAPARTTQQAEGGLRLEYQGQQWLVYDRGQNVVATRNDEAGGLELSGRLLRSMALTGLISRSLTPCSRASIEFDPADGGRWLVRAAGGGILGAYSAGLDDGLAQAARRLRSAGGGMP
jgi:hypothetical protein